MKASTKRRLLWTLGIVGLILAGAYYWLLVESATPQNTYAVDLVQVRALAKGDQGALPTEIRVESTAQFDGPEIGIIAGGRWAITPMTVYSYQVNYIDHSLLIDTAMDADATNKGGGTGFDAAAFARVSQGIQQAQTVVVTHEHFDHLGGLLAQPNLAALLPKAKVTSAQLSHPEKMDPLKPPEVLLQQKDAFKPDLLTALAPGVVLIQAPGHTPGSQWVYVQLQNGSEFLFVGDTAWKNANIEQVRERSRLATLMMGEDRTLVLSQLKLLNQWQRGSPQLSIVPGHDNQVVDALVDKQLLKRKFTDATKAN
jgi:glyoxylase-like metal-dependent hydrolase (beta-lactamase superfamily II)